MSAPCPSCPWRRSSREGGADIPGFDLDKMRRLANTVGTEDGFRPIMACHGSACGKERVCIGYARVEGYSNLSVRLLAIRGEIDFAVIDDACEGLDLWPSFVEILDAYEAALAGPE